jgi:hypothetical protein
MPDEQPSEFTAKIVASYVRRNQLGADQLSSLISTVHQALQQLGKPAAEDGVREPRRLRSGDPFSTTGSRVSIAAGKAKCSAAIS